MQRKFLVPLLCSFVLVGCEAKPAEPEKATYKVTIESTEHFTPSQTSFTFEEDDFTPIVVSYTVDSDYVVLNAKASDDAAECHVDYKKDNEIEIIPQVNQDFTVKVSLTRLSLVSVVRFQTVDHFTPERNKIVFKNDDFTPITVSYTLDDYCSLDTVNIVGGSAERSVDYDNQTVTITPKANDAITVRAIVEEEYKIVTFNPGEGKLGEYADEQILMPYGKTWNACVEYGRQAATLYPYEFDGWSFENGMHGTLINKDYVINKNTPSMVYASYDHKINLTSESLKVEDVSYANSKVAIQLKLKDDKRYSVPTSSTNFTVKSSLEDVPFTYYHPENSNDCYIVVDDNDAISSGIINIEVTDYRKEFSVSFTGKNGLASDDVPATVLQGDELTFNIKAVNTTNGIYYVPERLDIYVGESTRALSTSSYKIEVLDEYHQTAKVTIYSDYVTGNLKIEGECLLENSYYYAITSYGVTLNSYGTHKEGIQSGDSALSFIIEGADKDLVSGDNFAIKLNDKEWCQLSTIPYPFKSFIQYTKDNNTFTIFSNGSDTLKSIDIYVFSPNYSIFANASWSDIDQLSSSGFAYKLFSIGEKRQLITAHQTYDIRIIGFEHDTIQGSDKQAGLTIEFEQLITNEDGSVYNGGYKTHMSESFVGSFYDSYLNEELFTDFDLEIRPYIKNVEKYYYMSDPDSSERKTYYPKIFPLSVTELGFDIGYQIEKGDKTYEYYEGSTKAQRAKKGVGATGNSMYWTRSDCKLSPTCAFALDNKGDYHEKDLPSNHAYMAAFCI